MFVTFNCGISRISLLYEYWSLKIPYTFLIKVEHVFVYFMASSRLVAIWSNDKTILNETFQICIKTAEDIKKL